MNSSSQVEISSSIVRNPTGKVRNSLNNINNLNNLEFTQIAKQCAFGFAIMGTIGFVIKLVFLMINNILLS